VSSFGQTGGGATVALPITPAHAWADPTHAMLLDAAHAGARLVAVGEHGIMLLSDDGGRTYRQAKQVPASTTLSSVYFSDAQHGWATSGSGKTVTFRDKNNVVRVVVEHGGLPGVATARRDLGASVRQAPTPSEMRAQRTSTSTAVPSDSCKLGPIRTCSATALGRSRSSAGPGTISRPQPRKEIDAMIGATARRNASSTPIAVERVPTSAANPSESAK